MPGWCKEACQRRWGVAMAVCTPRNRLWAASRELSIHNLHVFLLRHTTHAASEPPRGGDSVASSAGTENGCRSPRAFLAARLRVPSRRARGPRRWARPPPRLRERAHRLESMTNPDCSPRSQRRNPPHHRSLSRSQSHLASLGGWRKWTRADVMPLVALLAGRIAGVDGRSPEDRPGAQAYMAIMHDWVRSLLTRRVLAGP